MIFLCASCGLPHFADWYLNQRKQILYMNEYINPTHVLFDAGVSFACLHTAIYRNAHLFGQRNIARDIPALVAALMHRITLWALYSD